MKRNKQIGWVSVLFFLAFFAFATSTLSAAPVNTYWKADPDTPASWHDSFNWSNGIPYYSFEHNTYIDNGGTALISADFDTHYLRVGNSGAGHIEQNGGIGSSSIHLYLGYESGSLGTYSLADGQLLASSQTIGLSGTGIFTQSGGTNAPSVHSSYLHLGSSPGATGAYNLLDGELAIDEQYIGGGGIGTFTQEGGTNTASNYLFIGYHGGSMGTYNLFDGQLSGAKEYVGYVESSGQGGTGTFTQSGGINEAGYLYVKEGSSYTLSGGILSISNSADIRGSFESAGGAWSLNVNGGLANFSRAVFAEAGSASFSSADGTLTIFPKGFDPATVFGSYCPSGLVRFAGSTIVINAGEGFSGQGTIEDAMEVMGTITGMGGALKFYAGLSLRGIGTIYTPANDIYLDKGAAGTLEDSGSISANHLYLGYTAGASGTLTQNGGTNTVSNLEVGSISDSTGAYDLIDGQLSSNQQLIGKFGKGTFTQSGGTNTVSGYLVVGYYSDSTGTYNLSGGQLSASSEDIGRNEGAVSAFIQSGGTNIVSETLRLGMSPGTTGTYNLIAGQLSAATQYLGGSPGLGFDGGTGIIIQSGGTNSVSKNLYLGYYPGSIGTYNLSGGQLLAANEYIGNAGTGTFIQDGGVNYCQYLRVGATQPPTTPSSYIFHSGQLRGKDIYVTPYGYFENSGGPGIREIFVTHSFLNESTYNEQFRLLNTTLILLGDGPNLPTTLDTNSLDMGLGLGGYYDNFALGGLIFRGSTLTQYRYKLLSDVYTLGLVIEDGAIVNLNGFTIYYIPMGGKIHLPPHYEPLSPSTFYLGGTWLNGDILPAVTIPEPGTVALIAPAILGIAGIAFSRMRRV